MGVVQDLRGDRRLADEHLVRPRPAGVLVDAQRRGGIGLGVQVHQQHPLAHLGQGFLPDGLTNLDTLFLEGNVLTNFNLPAGLTGLTYRVEYTLSLRSTNWNVLTNLVLSSSPSLIADESPSASAQRLYRAVQSP